MSHDKKEKAKPHPMTGPQKVAILMVSLGEERAAQVLKELKPQDVEKVVAEIARLGEVTSEKRRAVVKEILSVFDEGRNLSEGGWDYAKGALEKAMGEGRASMIMNQVGRPRREGFSALAAADPDKLVNVSPASSRRRSR
jgi:flagellar motor switch protein FliG